MSDDPIVADGRGDLGQIQVGGHDEHVEYDAPEAEQVAFGTFVDHNVLEAVGGESDA